MHTDTERPDPRAQCNAHGPLFASIDQRLDHITSRVDRIYEMLANGRNGGGGSSANTLTVTASGGAPAAPAGSESTPWPKVIALLVAIVGLIVTMIAGSITDAIRAKEAARQPPAVTAPK